MDFRLIAAVMIIMAILDMIGRMLRKRAGEVPGANGGAVEGGEVLKHLMGERSEAPGTGTPVRPGRDPGALAVRRQAEAAAPPAGKGFPAAERPAASAMFPATERLPTAAPPVTARDSRVLELRDRAPREIEIRSRNPRPVDSRPERLPAPSAAGLPPSAGPAPLPGAAPLPEPVPAGASRARREVPAPTLPTPARRTVDLANQLGLGGAGALRRAVLAREVLGRPLALREEE